MKLCYTLYNICYIFNLIKKQKHEYIVIYAYKKNHSYLSILTCISYFRVMWKHQDPNPTAANKSNLWLAQKSTCKAFRCNNLNAWTLMEKKKIRTSASHSRNKTSIFHSLLLYTSVTGDVLEFGSYGGVGVLFPSSRYCLLWIGVISMGIGAEGTQNEWNVIILFLFSSAFLIWSTLRLICPNPSITQSITELLVLLKTWDISAYCPVSKGKFYKELFVSSRSRT